MKTLDELRTYFAGLGLGIDTVDRRMDGADWLAGMHADPHEGAEWLPYYKLALSIESGIIGELCVMVEALLPLAPPKSRARAVEMLNRLVVEFAAASFACGCGPDERLRNESMLTALAMIAEHSVAKEEPCSA